MSKQLSGSQRRNVVTIYFVAGLLRHLDLPDHQCGQHGQPHHLPLPVHPCHDIRHDVRRHHGVS